MNSQINRTTNQPGGVAVVGAGYWGRNLVRNFHELGALAGVCDNRRATLDELGATFPGSRLWADVDDIFNDPTVPALAIATPAETHADLVRRALAAGKDVFVEKPLCLSVEDGRRLVAQAGDLGRVLMVGHLLWYHPAVLKLKDLIDAGDLGRLQYVYSHRLNLGKIRREENILWSFAPHDVSVILGLLGEAPDAVQAQGGNYLHPGIADVTVTTLSFPSGVRGHVFVSWLHPYKEQKLVVVGDRQMAVFDDVEKVNKLTLYPHTVVWKNQVPVANKAEGRVVPVEDGEPLRRECEHFLECVRDRARPRTDGAEGLRVLTVLYACQQALEGRPAPAPERPRYTAHPSAFVDDGVDIGEGTTIWHVSHVIRGSVVGRQCRIGQNVVIGPNVRVGDGCKIQNNVSVYEGVTLEDHVFCGPSMVFTNVHNPRSEVRRMGELRSTLVKRGATLGANCTVVCGTTIGRYAFVGAGAVVTRDVPDYTLVTGVPAVVRGWVCECGVRLQFKEDWAVCGACDRRYRKSESGITRAPAATPVGGATV